MVSMRVILSGDLPGGVDRAVAGSVAAGGSVAGLECVSVESSVMSETCSTIENERKREISDLQVHNALSRGNWLFCCCFRKIQGEERPYVYQ